jgi:hypothetical protein
LSSILVLNTVSPTPMTATRWFGIGYTPSKIAMAFPCCANQ